MDKDPELGIPTSTLQTRELDSTHQEGSGRSPKGRAQPRRGEKSRGILDGETASLLILLKDGGKNRAVGRRGAPLFSPRCVRQQGDAA